MSDEVDGCYGNAQPGDTHLAADIVAIDSDIITHLAEMALPVGFTDSQFEILLMAAATLPRARRDGFLRAVASHLGCGAVDDGDVLLAINEALHQ
jgi:hypothetical protein